MRRCVIVGGQTPYTSSPKRKLLINVTARTQEECEKKLKTLKEELGQAAQKIHSEMTFGEWIDYWYQSFCKPGLRDSTRTEYENAIYHHIIPSVGHIPLYKLTQNDLGCSLHLSISVSREILPRSTSDSKCFLHARAVKRFASTICDTPSQRWRSKTE